MMNQEHKHYDHASLLARKIFAEFERVGLEKRRRIDLDRVYYEINRFYYDSLDLTIHFKYASNRGLLDIRMAYKPRKSDKTTLKVSQAFISYLKNNCIKTDKLQCLLDILPSHRDIMIADILTELV